MSLAWFSFFSSSSLLFALGFTLLCFMFGAHVLNPSHTLRILILFLFTSKNFLIFFLALALTLSYFGSWLFNALVRFSKSCYFCFYLIMFLEQDLIVSPLFVFPLPLACIARTVSGFSFTAAPLGALNVGSFWKECLPGFLAPSSWPLAADLTH